MIRLTLALTLSAALLVACVALFFWYPPAAISALLFAVGSAVAVRLFSATGPIISKHGRDSLEGNVADAKDSVEAVSAALKSIGPVNLEVTDVPAGTLLEATMDSMREGVLVIDNTMRVVASNRAVRNLFNSNDGGSLASQRLSELTRNPAIHSAFSAALERGERIDVKVESLVGNERRIFDLHVAPLREPNYRRNGSASTEVRSAVGVFFDITRLERLERVRQEFLSNVSHELRTPLTAIITFVETLEDGAIDDPVDNRRFLSVIRRNSERMHNLIDDILELSAIEAGTVKVEIGPVRLDSLVNDIINTLSSKADEQKVELRNDVAPETIVYADARRLEQMITNLVHNAIKFNRENGSVTVSFEQTGERDRIHVIDTGEGIAPEHINRIFERFYRVDRARSRALGGTGLGLAIVKHLARAHGGEATVRSTPNQGSAFSIELPKAVTNDE